MSGQDVIIGVVGLALFLVAVFAVGKLVYAWRDAGLTRAWGPLPRVVQQGKIVGDEGGGASSWLTGTYRGQSMAAKMSPGALLVTDADGGSGERYNSFQVIALNVKGRSGWKLIWQPPIIGDGPGTWRLETKDAALKQALTNEGLIPLVDAFAPRLKFIPVVAYNRGQEQLVYEEDAGADYTPTSERFVEQLDFVQRLVELNGRLNGPGG